jgi:branched-chain amino acid transport system ATP-binding protein
VEENLLVAARQTGGAAAQHQDGAPAGAWDATGWSLDSVYELFGRLRERRRNKGTQLSGGEQQMLAIGRALMTNPACLLMDEPSEGLAPLLVREVGAVLRALSRRGLAILLVEQNLPLALDLASAIHVLSKGQAVFSGTPSALRGAPDVMARHLILDQA